MIFFYLGAISLLNAYYLHNNKYDEYESEAYSY